MMSLVAGKEVKLQTENTKIHKKIYTKIAEFGPKIAGEDRCSLLLAFRRMMQTLLAV